MTVIKAIVQNRRIDVPAPSDVPDGTEVVLTFPTTVDDEGPSSPEEIARILTAMQRLAPWEVPADVEGELAGWERRLQQHGIDHVDTGLEEVFP